MLGFFPCLIDSLHLIDLLVVYRLAQQDGEILSKLQSDLKTERERCRTLESQVSALLFQCQDFTCDISSTRTHNSEIVFRVSRSYPN